MVCHPPNDVERSLFALPAHLGGLGISNPCVIAADTYQFSRHVAGPIVEYILNQLPSLSQHVLTRQHNIFQDLVRVKRRALADVAKNIYQQCPSDLQHIIDCLQEKGSSSWLTSLPIDQHGFVLHKGDFNDALCLRYGWTPPRLPSHCVCGSDFSISHAFSCPHGALPTIRHNNVRDLTATLLSEVCHDVKVEPALQPLTGEALRYKTAVCEDDACLDICAAGFWSCMLTLKRPCRRADFVIISLLL